VKLAESQRALELAYRFLGRRERTVNELRKHLLARDIDEASIAAVIEELLEQGSLDDTRFARLFVQDKRALEQWGIDRIRRGLLGRGIDRGLIDDLLAAEEPAAGQDDGQESELDRALAVLRQRFPGPLRERRERDRALGVLLRKGYRPELALDALRTHSRDA
jgi:regulatory protein